MVLKGLPDSFKPFSIHITQSDEKITFTEFKTKLRSYESTEKFSAACSEEDSVMKVKARDGWNMKLTCFNCGQKGHKAVECTSATSEHREQRQWCHLCKSSTHKDVNCRRRKRDNVKRVVDEEDHTFAFKVGQVDAVLVSGVKEKGLMVDTGATSHIIRDITQFTDFDKSFEPHKHILELADGEKTSGIALRKGTAKVRLRDNKGRVVETMLMGALYVPSFPQDIFSVKAAMSQGATVIFKEGAGMVVDWEQETGLLMTSGDVRVIRIWDTEREMKVQDIPTGADSCVTSLSCDPQRSLVAAGLGDGSVRVYDRRMGPNECRVMTYREHGAWVVKAHLQKEPEGHIISVSVNGDVRFFDPRMPESINILQTVKGLTALDIHPQANLFACGSMNQFIAVYNSNGDVISNIKYYDGFMGQRIGAISCLAFHPYWPHLAVGSNDYYMSIYSAEKRLR
ncbi:hypothetical protein PO909_005836 [Leuciscus waleckii]